MSKSWGYVCLDHDPHLASEYWFNHGEDVLWDAWSRERAGAWPSRPEGAFPPEDWDPIPVTLRSQSTSEPIWWLRQHPGCEVALHNEYGDIERLPRRVQLSRARGWRKPANTVSVARPTRWGNPFTMQAYRAFEADLGMPPATDGEVRAELVACFRSVVVHGPDSAYWAPDNFEQVLTICRALDAGELRGKNLACWCPLDQACHADVLLELANGGPR